MSPFANTFLISCLGDPKPSAWEPLQINLLWKHIHTPCSISFSFKPWLAQLVFGPGPGVMVSSHVIEARAAMLSMSHTDRPMAALLGGGYRWGSGRRMGRMHSQGDYGCVTIADTLMLTFTGWCECSCMSGLWRLPLTTGFKLDWKWILQFSVHVVMYLKCVSNLIGK